jgi:dTDP-4-amino-4,6-dideoxygalactose transaminase
VKLDVFDVELKRRRAIAARYGAGLEGVVGVPAIPADRESAFAIYTIRVKHRDRVRALLDEAGIGTGLFYRLAVHEHPAFRVFKGRKLPVSEQLASEVLALPMHPDLTDEEVDRVIAAVRQAVAAG